MDQGGSGKPTGIFSSLLLKLTALKALAGAGPAPNPRFYGLVRFRNTASAYDEFQLTPPVGPGFGPGPQFSIPANLVPNVPYRISIAAENIQGYWGDSSAEWTFTWKTPPAFPTVAWPARALPPVTGFDDPGLVPPTPGVYAPRVAALLFTNFLGTLEDRHYPVGIRIGLASQTPYFLSNVGTTNLAAYNVYGGPVNAREVDPNNGIFKRYSSGNGALQNGQSLLPIVVYRKQETNGAFPRVSGHMTQVTPLIDRVAWSSSGSLSANGVFVTITDPLIAVGSEDFNDQYEFTFLYLRDQQPVIIGARYHYYVVRFNDQHEMAEVIDAGSVVIPSS